jgi:hypothetical protein
MVSSRQEHTDTNMRKVRYSNGDVLDPLYKAVHRFTKPIVTNALCRAKISSCEACSVLSRKCTSPRRPSSAKSQMRMEW